MEHPNLIPIIENSSTVRVLDERGRQLTTIYTCAESVIPCGKTFTVIRKGNSTTKDIYGWQGNSISRINVIYG